MIFKQVFDAKTSTYTYIIASAKGREAVIIDPVLENVDEYIQLLNELDLKLVKVIDTHIHADHVTGASNLKQATNCATLMGEHTPADAVEIKVKDNELIKIGKEELEEASGIPCWICSSDVINGQAWACLECGARYHMEGQVQGCNITEKGHCLHCDAAIDQLTEV